MSVFQSGNTAVITGGASGIGLALAAKCLASGMHVLVADKNAASLAATPKHAAQLAKKLYKSDGSKNGSLTTHAMDVSKLEDWAGLRSAVEDTSSTSGSLKGRINLLVLNAGVGGKTPWTDVAAFHKILDVNLWGVIHGIATLLPVVQATSATASDSSSATSVVITGSKQGITNPPGTSPAYNASKAAVRAIAEQLAYDLSKEEKEETAKTSVHLLVPGWTFTGLSGNDPIKQHGDDAEQRPQKPEGAWWPEQVVDYLLEAMNANKFYVICPDNDVTEDMDKKRILWSAGDITEGRQPLSRWRPDYKDAVDAWMKQ